jgi:hypothetical protein
LSTNSVEIAKVGQELAREVSGFGLNLAAVTCGAVRTGLEDPLHAPFLADAVVDTSEAVLGAKIEERGELVLDFRPGEFFDHTIVHDEELLLLVVRWTGKARDAWLKLSPHGCAGWLRVVVMGIVVVLCISIVDVAEEVCGVMRGR